MSVEQYGSGGSVQKPIFQIWIDAVTKPNVEAYREIVNDPKVSLGSAMLWLAGVGFISSLISGLIRMIFGWGGAMEGFLGSDLGSEVTFFGVIGGAFMSLIFTPLISLIMVGLIHLASQALGGTGSLEKMLYGYAAFWVPITLVNSLIGAVPVLYCLTAVTSIYSLFLCVIANQAVYGYETGKAVIASVGVPLLVAVAIGSCIFLIVVLGLASLIPVLNQWTNTIGMVLLLL